jgi:hypothetical protein
VVTIIAGWLTASDFLAHSDLSPNRDAREAHHPLPHNGVTS